MNFVVMLTDTQSLFMTGAYGNPRADTPNIDRLAREGVRFDRAYTTCPLCTPARAAIFTGLQPSAAGAWCNPVSPHRHVPMMGEIFSDLGYHPAYIGKWHLDGGGYDGFGKPCGGFDPAWWYDGRNYHDELTPAMARAFRQGFHSAADLRAAGVEQETVWGYRVADRAIDFLSRKHEQPFVLVCSFNEPHSPYVAPPEYWESVTEADLPRRPNMNAPVEDRPRLQRIFREELGEMTWERFKSYAPHWHIIGCNRFVDRQIGRVIDAVDRMNDSETTIVYTSDHGTPYGAHGWLSKGPAMFEETCAVPLIVRGPGLPGGAATQTTVSHVDLLPTLLDLASQPVPASMHGRSLVPYLHDPVETVPRTAMLEFGRFELKANDRGEFYPVRCLTDGRFKLIVNLLDSDEFYDLETDPGEAVNRINDPVLATERDRLHDALMAEMDRVTDPMRGWTWGDRSWRRVGRFSYWNQRRQS